VSVDFGKESLQRSQLWPRHNRKKYQPGAPLRGRGTPAIPARLRSERARNLYRNSGRSSSAPKLTRPLRLLAETRIAQWPRLRQSRLLRALPSVALVQGSELVRVLPG
jgi:hypothetical protein